jgi:KDO2-lipid IV(A) lauroyltransferase
MKDLLAIIEAALVRAILVCLRRLPADTASNLGGGFARFMGPLLPVSKVADRNLRLAMPELDKIARKKLVLEIWENLGRTVCEMPHLGRLPRDSVAGPGWSLQGTEITKKLLSQGGPVIFFSGHIANWEMWGRVASDQGFVPNGLIYRAAANKHVDKVLADLRAEINGGHTRWFPKGAAGARQAMAHLKAGHYLLMLADQKMNDGVEARFFGKKAMSPPALAALALRYRCPVVPAFCRRVGPARFVMVVEPPLTLPDSGDKNADILALTQAVNDKLEARIREVPGQWLWLHKRWPKD